MRTKLFLTVISLMVGCGCAIQQKNEMKKAEWLIGTWEHKTSRGSIYETWTKINDVEFSGKSYILKEKDTIVFETIRLFQEPGGLFYVPKIKNQNDGWPVTFALKTITDTTLVFENPEHDFPQIISYTRVAPDSLIAEISGMKNEQELTQAFPMIRVD